MLIQKIHKKSIFPRRKRVLANHISSLLTDSFKILDVGTGDGSIAAEILKIRPELQVLGLDVLARIESHIHVTLFDGKTIPFQENSFDVVLFIDVLHHTHHPVELLREAARVSKKYLIIKDHYEEGFLSKQTLSAMDWVGNASHGVALPYNYLNKKQWTEAFQKTGIRPIKTISELNLYPRMINWIFGRNLHFITLLEKTQNHLPDFV